MTKFDDLRVLTRAVAFRLIVGTMHFLPILGFSVLRMHSSVMFGTKFPTFFQSYTIMYRSRFLSREIKPICSSDAAGKFFVGSPAC